MSTHNIPFLNIKKKITLNYPRSAALEYFLKGLKKEFEPAMVNEPSVLEPLKVYCSCELDSTLTLLHSERPKLYGVLSVLSAVGLITNTNIVY